MRIILKIDPISLITELQQIHSLVKDVTEAEILDTSSSQLQATFKRLDELASMDTDEKYINELLKSPEFSLILPSISNFRFLFNLKLEIEKANTLLSSQNPWQALQNFTFYPNYLQLSRTELLGSGLKPENSVIFLGSGPLPLSLIVLCHEYNLFGTGIEQDENRASLSRKVIAKLGLSEKIQIITGNHFILPLKTPFDLYMIAAQAEPKKQIFQHLAEVLPEGSKISYRVYEKGLRKILDNSFHFEVPTEFEEYLRVQPEPPVNNTVVFLRKKF